MKASNFRSEETLSAYLQRHNVVGIADIDTRRLTRILREKGAQNGCIMVGELDENKARELAQKFPGLKGMDLAKEVCCDKPYDWQGGSWQLGEGHTKPEQNKYHVVAYDYGCKHNILRLLADRNCKITVVPAQTSAEDVLALKPDGVFLSNGLATLSLVIMRLQQSKPYWIKRFQFLVFALVINYWLLPVARTP